MKSLRESLPDDFLAQIQKELGREEALRLLWPVIVGAKLGSNTQLRSVRQNTLRVSVPDRNWKKTLRSFEKMILEAVHRFCGEEIAQAVEFVEEPRRANPQRNIPQKSRAIPRPLPPLALPLEAIGDRELQEIFRLSAEKYFARQAPLLAAPRWAESTPERKSGTGQEGSTR